MIILKTLPSLNSWTTVLLDASLILLCTFPVLYMWLYRPMIHHISERKEAQKYVYESERKLSFHLQNTPIAAIEWNHDFEVVEWNAAAERIFGFTKDEVLGRHAVGLIVPESARDHVYQVWNDLRENAGGFHSINENLSKDGRILMCDWNNTPLVDESGKVFGVTSLVQDITERTQMEEKLKESERKSLAWLENSPVCTKVLDLDFNLQYMSTAGIESLQIKDVTELYGKPYPFDFYPDSFRKPMIENLRKAKETGEIITQEASVVDIEGNELWFHSTIIPVNNDKGHLDYIMVLSVESTERKRAEDEMKRISGTLQMSISKMPIAYILWDKNKTTLEWNKAAEDIFGYTSEEMLGNSLFDAIVPGDILHRVDQITDELFAGKSSSYSAKNNNIRKDGKLISCMWHNTPLSDAKGQVTSILSMAQDVTETKRLEELESRAARLETAGTIAGQVAHDFNNLLAPMMAYPEFIREKLPEDHPILKYLDQIEQAAHKIADINQQLLTLGRRGHYNQDVLNLNTIVKQAVNEVARLTDSVTCETDLNPDLMNILGGGSQIHRVITNLLCNAVDALQNIGHINIKTENYYADDVSGAYGRVPKGEYVKLTISDTGCGISDDIVQKILDPFFTTKTTDQKRGSGLGLSVVNAVVKDHGGYLDLETQSGKGTSFYIYFPISHKSSDEDHSDKTSGGSETILVVDDDNIQRDVSTQLLKKLGYEVISVESGEKAIEFLRENPCDLVILDMIMPGGIDGAETYQQIYLFNPNQKAIMVSGFSESDRVKVAQELGAGAFVKKPLTKKAISVAVRAELDRQAKVTMDGPSR
jgi:PAS domain S-box-containing protein